MTQAVRTLFVVATLTVAALASCAPAAVNMRNVPRDYDADDYMKVYRRWTRETESFSWRELRHAIHVGATLQSAEFRSAYVARFARDYSVTSEEREKLMTEAIAEANASVSFVLTLSSDIFRESDLTSKDTAWKVFLRDSTGRQIEPTSIERIRHPTPADLVYFPIIHLQREAFHVKFPANIEGKPTVAPEAEYIVLRVTGARGRADLTWKLRD